MDKNKRIAKNAFYLYCRMFLMICVTLFTSRVILQTLGIEDFGIYNVVAGIVILFTFINNAMATASQRFLSFELGKNDLLGVKKVFSVSLTSHFLIALLVFILAETIGLWILSRMNFPEYRIDAVKWVYQFTVLTCIVNIIRVPYNAIIIAYERMSFYAWIGLIEVFLKLLIVYLIFIYKGDKLVIYSLLLLVVTILINLIYKIYSNIKISTSKYFFYWDRILFEKFFSFSGWSLTGSLANVGTQQGLNMIINIFCGVTVNAAVGVSNQVMAALGQFLSSFQTAFNPQLVKSYANGEKDYFMDLIFKTSKFSYYLMFIVSLPILVNSSFLLHLWLGIVPRYAVEFSQLVIVFILFDAISGPLWISVQATGKIKTYQLIMTCVILLNLPLSFLLLKLGLSPIYVFLSRTMINLLILFIRIFYLRNLISLPSKKYVKTVLLPIILVTLFATPFSIWLKSLFESDFIGFIFNAFFCVCFTLFVIFLIGLSKTEKTVLINMFITKISKYK